MNPKVDVYLGEVRKWREELAALRTIILGCGLTEELKWGIPCYTFRNSNVVGINGLKEFCALSFFKGVLLSDTEEILVQPGENTQAGRWIKFTGVREIIGMKAVLNDYIREAIEVEIAGLKVAFKDNTELELVDELLRKFDGNPSLRKAFEALTPGRQRAYNLYFSAAKQSKTRESRIDQYTPRILDGKGFHDCTCGLSNRMPTCDGSHKFAK